MKTTSPQEISSLLQAWHGGDQGAFDKLVPLVYDELHRLAHRYMMRERDGSPLQTTALVNEAYLRLIDVKNVEWQGRVHFFAISAKLMRRILVDFARKQKFLKRSGNRKRVSLENALCVTSALDPDLVKLDDALNALAELYPRKAEVVELKFFGGLSIDETSEVLKVSRDTVKGDWRFAKAWLLREMKERKDAGKFAGS
jgi:RNA polymerase sigma factor (TIGR02999 family)